LKGEESCGEKAEKELKCETFGVYIKWRYGVLPQFIDAT
jgi:hypothetical protein